MLPHRRLGNRLLTGLLRFMARAPISDGQSGFRTSGRSFVRPLCYLRRVAPAVWRELNPAETVSRTASAQPGNP